MIQFCDISNLRLPKNLYKNYTKCIQNTKFIYIFCIQRLYKSKFCMMMKRNVHQIAKCIQKCKNSAKLVQSSNRFLYIQTMYKLYKIYTTS